MHRFLDMGVLDPRWTNTYCKGDFQPCVRYRMEERGEFHPDWMLPDGTLDEQLERLCREAL